MISPYEFLALFIVMPIVAAGVWIANRFDTDGAPVEAFEAWCKSARPLLFAVRCDPAEAASLCAALLEQLGAERRVEHRAGRYPWTRYVLTLTIETDDAGVVRGRTHHAKIRRLRQHWPDLEDVLTRGLEKVTPAGVAWLHTELRDGDEARGDARRGRGWSATLDGGAMKDFELTTETPTWARGEN